MPTYLPAKQNRSTQERAQAIVEFAIVLPILLLILIGLLEVGRMIFQYTAVTNASREAARYASAVGVADGTTYNKYQYCTGIKEVAKRAALLTNLSDADIAITYDHGTTGTTFDTCDGSVDTGVAINSGTYIDRATITITTTYNPMVNLIPIPSRSITATSSRTIIGVLQLDNATGSGGGPGPGGGSTDTPTATATVATATSTSTPVDTPTPTDTPEFVVTFTPTNTPTATPTSTPTATATSTPTSTPTATPTPLICGSISASTININNKVMSVTVSNPTSDVLTVLSVQVSWNYLTGAPGNNPLALTKVEYGTTNLWPGTGTGSDNTGSRLTTLSPAVAIPAGGTSSAFTYTFDKNYAFPTGKTSATFNLSSPICGTMSITTTK